MRAIYVPVDPETAEALHVIARRETRSPKDQATVLLREAALRALDAPPRRSENPSTLAAGVGQERAS